MNNKFKNLTSLARIFRKNYKLKDRKNGKLFHVKNFSSCKFYNKGCKHSNECLGFILSTFPHTIFRTYCFRENVIQILEN